MTYGKITSEGQIMTMPNPIRITIANGTDEQKVLLAKLDNWLVVKETEPPTYNPETEYIVCHYEQDGSIEPTTGIPYAVQIWEVKPIEEPTESQ